MTPSASGSDSNQKPTRSPAWSPLTVRFSGDHAGERVGFWLLSDPLALGVMTVDALGTAQVTVPVGTAGDHRLVAVAADGTVIGWQDISITAEDTGLAATGVDAPWALVGLAMLVIIAGGAMTLRRRIT